MSVPPKASLARPRRPRRPGVRVALLYARALVNEFRWTLGLLAVAIVAGAVVLLLTPGDVLKVSNGQERLGVGQALYEAWMAMLAQPVVNQPPVAGHLMVLFAAYPILGAVLIGEGVVRLALLTVSRKYREKEWTKLTASTYRDHVILCGLGHLGVRVLEQLVESGTPAVVLEKRRGNPMLVRARELKVPVLVRDMKEDQALIDAGVRHARAVVICTNDDMANLEVALDSRRLNPKVRIVMRLFEQQLASKISDALDVDAAFSSSSLAAPLVAAMSLQARVLSTALIGGVSHVTAEVTVEDGSRFAGRRVDELETGFGGRVLALTAAGGPLQSPPSAAAVVRAGDVVVFHTPATQLATVAAAARRDA